MTKKTTVLISTPEERKELAAKTAAAIAAKKAAADATKDMELEEKKTAEAQKPAAETKPAKKPFTQKPIRASKSIEEQHESAASEAAANSGKVTAPKPETKEQKESKKQAEFATIAADLLKKTKINIGAARTDKKDVRAGDIIAFHQNGEFLQVFKVAFMTPDKSIMLQLQREDSLHNPPDSVGAWTFEDWRINGLRNVFASRKDSRDKFIRVAIFAGV